MCLRPNWQSFVSCYSCILQREEYKDSHVKQREAADNGYFTATPTTGKQLLFSALLLIHAAKKKGNQMCLSVLLCCLMPQP